MSKTVTVTTIDDWPNCLKMTWQSKTRSADVSAAFQEIKQHLDSNAGGLYVIVILNEGVNMPVNETIIKALTVYADSRLLGWLVIGGDSKAYAVKHMLSFWTKRDNVHWFKTEGEAQAYLKMKMPRVS